MSRQPQQDQQPQKPESNKGFSLLNIVQFLGASSIVGIATWSLSSLISAKGNQQQQLNTFINTISDFMIQNNLDGQTSGKPELPAVSRAARGYALNTLSTLDGILFIEDKPKKLSLLKFLYDSELIGYCRNSVLGSNSLAQTSEQCQVSRIKLKDARLNGLNFSELGSIIRGINLSGTYLSYANLRDMDLSFSNFSRANLRSAQLGNSMLHNSNLSNAFLVNADLTKTDLSQSNLDGAQLCGADLTGAGGLNTAKHQRVTFDNATKLPAKGKDLLLANQGIEVGPNQIIKDCKDFGRTGE